MALASTIIEQVSVRKIAEDEYVSRFNPDKMGNTANIAYGGCTLGVGVKAAYQTVLPGYHCYSLLGNYLGPALTDRIFYVKIRRIRDTRTFASRQVEISQKQDNGTLRACMIFFAEFQVQEPASLLTYSAPPTQKWTSLEDCISRDDALDELIKAGKVQPQMVKVFKTVFGLMQRYWEGKAIPESVMAQNMYGMAKKLPTTQDKLPITSKISAEYMKCKHVLSEESDQIAALSFHMDGALSFIPLTHNHQFLQDAGATSSLDFALRFFSNSVNVNDWHLKEIKTHVGAEGRTYSESQLWDPNGNMVASMTQQSIMRPPQPKKSKPSL